MSTDPLDFEDDIPADVANDAPPETEPTIDPEIADRARKYGWKSPDEWQGDPPPNGFMDPADYLTKPAVRLKMTEERLEEQTRAAEAKQQEFEERIARIDRMNAQTLERQKAAHKAELDKVRAEMRQAVELGDVERYDALSKHHDDLSGQSFDDKEAPKKQDEPPAVAAFKRDHAWVLADKVALAMVSAIGAEVSANGGDAEKQVAAAVAELKRRYPERYGEPRTRPQRVDGGSLATPGASLVAKLPPEARRQMKQDIADGLYASEKEWAAVYFEEEV